MKCRTAQMLLTAGLDGQCEPRRESDLQVHVAACPACRAFADALPACMETLNLLSAPEPQPGFTSRLMDRLPTAQFDHPHSRRWFKRIATLPAAAAVLAFACGVSLAYFARRVPETSVVERKPDARAIYADSFTVLPKDSPAAQYLALLQPGED